MTRWTLVLAFVLVALSNARPAHADSSPKGRAAADALYEEGTQLIRAKRYAEACAKLEASLELELGIGATLRLAYCYEMMGRTASASSRYKEAEAMAQAAGDDRAEEAADLAKKLAPKLSLLALDVAPENVGVAVIKRDGKVLDPATWGTALPVDPGEHEMEASAPGRVTWKARITIAAKPGTQRMSIPALEPAGWGGRQIAGVAGMALGGAGLVVGSIFGGLAAKKLGEAKNSGHCDQDWATCDATGMGMRDSAKSLAHGSTAGLVAGGAVLAAGVVLFATAPIGGGGGGGEGKSTAWVRFGPVAGAGMTGVLIRGGF